MMLESQMEPNFSVLSKDEVSVMCVCVCVCVCEHPEVYCCR